MDDETKVVPINRDPRGGEPSKKETRQLLFNAMDTEDALLQVTDVLRFMGSVQPLKGLCVCDATSGYEQGRIRIMDACVRTLELAHESLMAERGARK